MLTADDRQRRHVGYRIGRRVRFEHEAAPFVCGRVAPVGARHVASGDHVVPVVGVGGLDDLVEGRFVLGVGVGHGADPERGAERRFLDGGAFQVLAGVGVYAHVDLAHVSREGFRAVREEAVHMLQRGADDAPQRFPRAVPVDVVRIFAARVVLQYPVGDVRLVVGGEDVVVGLLPPFVDPLAQLPVVYGPLFHVRSFLSVVRMIHRPWSREAACRAGTRCLQGPIIGLIDERTASCSTSSEG